VILASFASLLPTDISTLESSISALESSISALDNAIPTLDSSVKFWEYVGFVGALLVVFGVLLELHDIWRRYGEEMTTWAFSYFGVSRSFERPKFFKNFGIEVASVILVAGGVACELGAGFMIESKNTALRAIDIQLRSKNAALRAASDRLVALLNQGVEAEHLARFTIEARVAFRHLTAGQQQEIAASLKPLCSGQMVSLSSALGDPESRMFAIDIANALQATKALRVSAPGVLMTAVTGSSPGEPISPLRTGVIVRVFAHSSQLGSAFSPNPQLGKAIAKELAKRGFDVLELEDEKYPTLISVEVNPHPEGPQGEYKLQAEQEAKAKNAVSSQK
jgi:hypothetical protein